MRLLGDDHGRDDHDHHHGDDDHRLDERQRHEAEDTRRLSSTRKNLVSAIFDDAGSAEDAYDKTREYGYDRGEISLLMSKDARNEYFPDRKVETHEESKALEGAGVGGAVGLTAGAIAGALAAVGTTVALPGIGLVLAGPIAVGLAGAGAGGITGGVIGALVGSGMKEERAEIYRTAIEEGGIVLAVHPHNEEEAEKLADTFRSCGGKEVYRG